MGSRRPGKVIWAADESVVRHGGVMWYGGVVLAGRRLGNSRRTSSREAEGASLTVHRSRDAYVDGVMFIGSFLPGFR